MTKKVESPETGAAPKVDPTPVSVSEQSHSPDFDALSFSEHSITATAESEEKRGRPKLSDEQRELNRQARRDARKKTSAKKPGIEAIDDEKTKAERLGVAKGNALMVCGFLELICHSVSDGTHRTSPEQLSATQMVWTEFLLTQDVTLPPWLQVTIVSVSHILPALRTDAGSSKVSGIWDKAKAWWTLSRGK